MVNSQTQLCQHKCIVILKKGNFQVEECQKICTSLSNPLNIVAVSKRVKFPTCCSTFTACTVAYISMITLVEHNHARPRRCSFFTKELMSKNTFSKGFFGVAYEPTKIGPSFRKYSFSKVN